jgi:hypothetical protein
MSIRTIKSKKPYVYLVTLMVESDTPINYTPFEDTLIAGRVISVNETGKPTTPYGLSITDEE